MHYFVRQPELPYQFQEVLFDADIESALLGLSYDDDSTFSSSASSLIGTMTPPTELGEEDDEIGGKGASASDETKEPIGLGLTLANEQVCFDLHFVVIL